MKGIIFTAFFDLVEEKFGYEMVDELITETSPESEGIYTTVGTYDHSELVNMVVLLSQKTNIPLNELLKIFGKNLFLILINQYKTIALEKKTAFELFESIDPYIHKEVKKLYSDAETPKFQTVKLNDQTMVMTYISSRKMADVAEGLMEGCLEYYKSEATISRKSLLPDNSKVEFTIKLN